jgi:hypothetical protein
LAGGLARAMMIYSFWELPKKRIGWGFGRQKMILGIFRWVQVVGGSSIMAGHPLRK